MNKILLIIIILIVVSLIGAGLGWFFFLREGYENIIDPVYHPKRIIDPVYRPKGIIDPVYRPKRRPAQRRYHL